MTALVAEKQCLIQKSTVHNVYLQEQFSEVYIVPASLEYLMSDLE